MYPTPVRTTDPSNKTIGAYQTKTTLLRGHRGAVGGAYLLAGRFRDLAAARDHLAGEGLRQNDIARRTDAPCDAPAPDLERDDGRHLPRRGDAATHPAHRRSRYILDGER